MKKIFPQTMFWCNGSPVAHGGKVDVFKNVDFMIDLLTIGKGKCGNTGLIKVGTNWRHHLKGVWLGSRCERLQERVVCVICR